MERLSRGVFEVVSPKLEDETVRYADPLPVGLLPFRERTSKFWSRGTAFAIAPNRFVSAAHVLPFLNTLNTHSYLRSATGATYEIGRILKYSQYRDLVEFELVSPAPNVVPFDRGTSPGVGDTVLAVGNALGEGVIFRSGSITSFTPEELEGRWQFIRFTAPASPGNSGGPLVDGSGRVIGVVVRKSPTENLNSAVPVSELDNLSPTQSEFWLKGLPFGEDHKQMFFDWKFESPLPSALADLRQAARRSFIEFCRKSTADLDAKYGGEIFPQHPNLKTFLRHPFIPFGLGQFSLDRSGQWSISHLKYTNKEIAPGQWVYYAEKERYAQSIIDRPHGTSLLQFFQAPKTVADTILKVLAMRRPFAGKQIPIESYGEPQEQERWVDALGRPWFTSVWRLGFADESVVLDCLTNPGGLACDWKTMPLNVEEGYRLDVKRLARRVTLSYYGHVKDWIEFLALPESYKPKALAGKDVSVRLDKGLAVNVGGFRGTMNPPLLSEDSTLSLLVGLDAGREGASAFDPTFLELRLKSRTDKATRVGIARVYAPTADSPEADVHLWSKLSKAEAPYGGVLEVEGKENGVRNVRQPDRKTTPEVLYIYFCWSGSEDDKNEPKKTCADLNKNVQVVEPAP